MTTSIVDYQYVLEFINVFEQPIYTRENVWEHSDIVNLRIALIEEELSELKDAILADDQIEIIDAICDILYVVHGMRITFGMNSVQIPKERVRPIRIDIFEHLTPLLSSLKQACTDRNWDIADSLTRDLLSFIYSIGNSYDLERCMKIVHDSNISKSCRSESEAQETVDWYKANESKYDSPTYRKSVKGGNYWIVYNQSSGKILKNKNYIRVQFV